MSLSDLIELGLVWGAAIATLRPSIRRSGSAITSGVLLWAVGVSLQVNTVYVVLDPLLGSRNWANLICRTFCLLALDRLEIMVSRAVGEGARRRRRETVVHLVTMAVVVCQAAVFVANKWPGTSTYLTDYAGQLGREVYWCIVPVSVAVFGIHVLVSSLKEWRAHAGRSIRWGVALIATSAALSLVWAAENVASSAVSLGMGRAWYGAHPDPLSAAPLGVMIITTGLGVAVASSGPVVETLWLAVQTVRIRGLWRRVVAVAPEVSLSGAATGRPSASFEAGLYRRWVEIVDADQRQRYSLSNAERHLLDQIGDTLLGRGGAVFRSNPSIGQLISGRVR